jgi:hypothetical protein
VTRLPAAGPATGLRVAFALGLLGAVALGAACKSKTDGGGAPTAFDAFDGAAYPSTRPVAKLPPGAVALVGSAGHDTLRWVDLATGAVFFTAPAGRDPVDVDGPRVVGGDGDGGAAYALLTYPNATIAAGPHASRGLSPRAGWFQKLAMDDLRVVGEVRVGALTGEAALSDDGARLVGTRFDTRPLDAGADAGTDPRSPLFVVATAQLSGDQAPPPAERTACIAPSGIALTHPHGETAFVACYGEDALLVVALGQADAPVRVPLGAGTTPPTVGPLLVALAPANDMLAVATSLAADVRFFDVQKGAFVDGRVAKLGGQPQRMEWSGTKLAVPTADADALIVLDGATGAPLASRTFDAACVHPRQAAWSDASLVVVCEGDASHDGALLVLAQDTLATTRAIPLPGRPTSFTLARPR